MIPGRRSGVEMRLASRLAEAGMIVVVSMAVVAAAARVAIGPRWPEFAVMIRRTVMPPDGPPA